MKARVVKSGWRILCLEIPTQLSKEPGRRKFGGSSRLLIGGGGGGPGGGGGCREGGGCYFVCSGILRFRVCVCV
jgi:hypothetical protein